LPIESLTPLRYSATSWIRQASRQSAGWPKVEAALALVEVVGDVGGEVGLDAVLADHDAVLVVAELGGAEPGGAVLDVEPALLAKPLERAVDRAAVGERLLAGPDVEVHSEAVEVAADVREHRVAAEHRQVLPGGLAEQRAAARDHRVDVLVLVAVGRIGRQVREHLGGGAPQRLADARAQCVRHRQHVVAAIAVGRERQRLAAGLEVADPQARGQDLHLPSGVVDVVLAPDRVARGLEDPRQRVAIGGLAAVTDVHRAGRVSRHEFDQHAMRLRQRAAAPACAEFVHAREFLQVQVLGEPEVDEAGAGHLGLLEQRARR